MQLPQDHNRAQSFDQGTAAYSYAIPSLRQERSVPLSGQLGSTSIYHRDYVQANCSIRPNLMLDSTNYSWPWTTTYIDSSYFGGDQDLLQMFPYYNVSENPPQLCHGVFGAPSFRPRMPFGPDSSFDISSPPPSSLYSGYSTSDIIPDEPLPQPQFGTGAQNENGQPRMAWNGTLDNLQGNIGTNGLDSVPSASHCGFRACSSNRAWFDPLPTTNWSNPTYEPRTVSPKVLTLNSSSTIIPVKCPEVLTASRKDSITDPKSISLEDSADPPQSVKRSRKRLPAGKPSLFPAVPTIPSNSTKKVIKGRARSSRTTNPIPKPFGGKPLSRLAPAELPPTPQAAQEPKKLLPVRQAATGSKKTQPKPSAPVAPLTCVTSKSTVPTSPVTAKSAAKLRVSDLSAELIPKVNALKRQDSKDRFLVQSKLAGMSYKEIRKTGKFTEAESTLRGRFRTLTKEKEARVRRPKWEDNDVRVFRFYAREHGANGKIDQTSAKSGSRIARRRGW